MSDTQTQSYTPAKTAPRKTSVWVWLVVLLIAIGALAAAIWWVGGVGEVGKLLGVSNLSLPSFSLPSFGGTPAQGTSPAPSAGSVPTTASALPLEAQNRMFSEQMESRVALTDLVQGRIHSLTLGTPRTAENSATVPLTATYTDGSTISGTLTFAKYDRVWYFFSLGREANKESGDAVSLGTFDSGAVSTLTQQQAEAGTQEMIAKGVLGGGFRVAKVEDVQGGPRTATVDLTLSGGSEPAATGRFVCISKIDAGTTYWFVARFEKR